MKTPQQEFLRQLEQIKYPVIILPDIANKETACAGLALQHILKQKLGQADLVAYKKLDPQISFLPGFNKIQNKIEHARDFVLSFDTGQNPIKDVRWEEKKQKLNIFVTPQKGLINPKDFSFAPGQFRYDFVIVLGAAELLHVGTCYEYNADLFFDLPIANLDYHISNEQYGQINLVDVKASGVTELAANIFLETKQPISQEAADCFYAGLLESTESFQSPRTTPKTLKTAARLIDQGANHKQIVKNLYKTQSIKTIKLWGKLMSQMRYRPSLNLAWISFIPHREPGENPVTTQVLRSIFDKIRNSYRKADTFMLLWETNKGVTRGLIQNSNRELLKDLLKGIEWGNAIIFEQNAPLKVAEEKILETLKQGYKMED